MIDPSPRPVAPLTGIRPLPGRRPAADSDGLPGHAGEITGAQLMMDVLLDEGVRHVFGNPGATELPLLQCLAGQREITHVLVLQEATALALADGYARFCGHPAFVNLHTAAGQGNAIGALTDAAVARLPMVVTAGQQDLRLLHREPVLAGDLTALARPTVKWAHQVTCRQGLGPVLRHAFRLAQAPPAGPVFPALPMNLLDEAGPPAPAASAVPRLTAADTAPHPGTTPARPAPGQAPGRESTLDTASPALAVAQTLPHGALDLRRIPLRCPRPAPGPRTGPRQPLPLALRRPGLGHARRRRSGTGHLRPPLCVIGDGSALYSPQALRTAAHLRAPVGFLIVNDRTYQVLRADWQLRDPAVEQTLGLDIDDPAVDFTALAHSMGVPARKVTTHQDLTAPLLDGCRSGAPSSSKPP
ncbi:benzoylformate decarboxylase [Kitasatospora sp. SolWspMP-SS2h]|uniref:thiamine pyrophosphate-binding protein n=1 Tax=Kitasatospora sp. SolWspMP-SS2h TaxID=1305729 RepID=UPI000DB9F008|nr:thiamine pyrophosphate-binding protein [Kitasatospora sp. SolWspMP-SS2h]RAJ31784.1 benzoylformate decarboxylase [Kitasatospora sp. SolWspMP-SS2h]